MKNLKINKKNGSPSQNIIIIRVQLQIILLNILEQIIRSQNFRDLHQLIIIIDPLEKRFSFKYLHPSGKISKKFFKKPKIQKK